MCARVLVVGLGLNGVSCGSPLIDPLYGVVSEPPGSSSLTAMSGTVYTKTIKRTVDFGIALPVRLGPILYGRNHSHALINRPENDNSLTGTIEILEECCRLPS